MGKDWGQMVEGERQRKARRRNKTNENLRMKIKRLINREGERRRTGKG